MSKFLAGIVFTVVVGALVAFFYTRDGHMPVNADVSPGKVETYLATRAFDASVERHAPKMNNPVQPTDENLKRGLAIYSMNCAVCHGTPGKDTKTVGMASYPPAPQFNEDPPDMPDFQNYWIIKHGVRYTAMPSWGKMLSDDDMWTLATFLSRYKDLPPAVRAGVQ
ncbi:MAG: cytochrome c [Acidobacteriaceae bacterium]|nr:cytochrome c [Acidobacteriaceae bacterium]